MREKHTAALQYKNSVLPKCLLVEEIKEQSSSSLTCQGAFPYTVRWYLNRPVCDLPYTLREAVSLILKAHIY
jgi:hypothetical protein